MKGRNIQSIEKKKGNKKEKELKNDNERKKERMRGKTN